MPAPDIRIVGGGLAGMRGRPAAGRGAACAVTLLEMRPTRADARPPSRPPGGDRLLQLPQEHRPGHRPAAC